MAEIFADGFSQWLMYFSKDRDITAKAFAHMFVLDQFYVALAGDRVAAFGACTDCQRFSTELQSAPLRRHLGWFKGTMAALILKKESKSRLSTRQPKRAPSSLLVLPYLSAAKEQPRQLYNICWIICRTVTILSKRSLIPMPRPCAYMRSWGSPNTDASPYRQCRPEDLASITWSRCVWRSPEPQQSLPGTRAGFQISSSLNNLRQ